MGGVEFRWKNNDYTLGVLTSQKINGHFAKCFWKAMFECLVFYSESYAPPLRGPDIRWISCNSVWEVFTLGDKRCTDRWKVLQFQNCMFVLQWFFDESELNFITNSNDHRWEVLVLGENIRLMNRRCCKCNLDWLFRELFLTLFVIKNNSSTTDPMGSWHPTKCTYNNQHWSQRNAMHSYFQLSAWLAGSARAAGQCRIARPHSWISMDPPRISKSLHIVCGVRPQKHKKCKELH